MSDEKSSAAWAGVPVAWAAVASNGTPLWLSYDRRDAGMPIGGRVIPLYSHRSPTLTDAEREAVELAAEDCRYHQDPGGRAAFIEATLRGLLDRHENLPDREHPARKEWATPARSGETGGDSPDRE
jgi:hypothetical protein